MSQLDPNVFVERLWRSVKYEEVYLKDYEDGWEAAASLTRYFEFYRHRRLQRALDYRTSAAVYGQSSSSRRDRSDEINHKSGATVGNIKRKPTR